MVSAVAMVKSVARERNGCGNEGGGRPVLRGELGEGQERKEKKTPRCDPQKKVEDAQGGVYTTEQEKGRHGTRDRGDTGSVLSRHAGQAGGEGKEQGKECPDTGVGVRDYKGHGGMHTPGYRIGGTRSNAYRSPKQGAR